MSNIICVSNLNMKVPVEFWEKKGNICVKQQPGGFVFSSHIDQPTTFSNGPKTQDWPSLFIRGAGLNK